MQMIDDHKIVGIHGTHISMVFEVGSVFYYSLFLAVLEFFCYFASISTDFERSQRSKSIIIATKIDNFLKLQYFTRSDNLTVWCTRDADYPVGWPF